MPGTDSTPRLKQQQIELVIVATRRNRMSLSPSDGNILAEGEQYLLVETTDGYQIWPAADYPAQRRRRLPEDEFVRTRAGLSAAWAAYTCLEPEAAESSGTFSSVEPETESSRFSSLDHIESGQPWAVASHHPMVTTRFELAGHRIVKELGVVTSSTVRARNSIAKLIAGFSQNFGGELSGYTRLVADARQEAFDRMCADARARGANAIVSANFNTGELFEIAVEILAFGTAVVVTPTQENGDAK
jgi:uncharacterized protein YbjQ (UPF0145 family)